MPSFLSALALNWVFILVGFKLQCILQRYLDAPGSERVVEEKADARRPEKKILDWHILIESEVLPLYLSLVYKMLERSTLVRKQKV